MTPPSLVKLIGVSSLAIILAACDTLPTASTSTSSPTPTPVLSRAGSIDSIDVSKYSTVVERIFAEGLNFYDKGEYAEAIQKFQAPELATAWPELRVRALKYLAFSYCVTDDLRACQQAFYDALQLNPQFKLLPAEEGHPIWDPVFQKAKSGPPRPAQAPSQPANNSQRQKR